jgi:hypothetical protein
VQGIGRQPQRAPDVASERHRREQTTWYRLVQQHSATFFAQASSSSVSPSSIWPMANSQQPAASSQ